MTVSEKFNFADGRMAHAIMFEAMTMVDGVPNEMTHQIVQHGPPGSEADLRPEPEQLAELSSVVNLGSFESYNRVVVIGATSHATPADMPFDLEFGRKTSGTYETAPGIQGLVLGASGVARMTVIDSPFPWNFLTNATLATTVADSLKVRADFNPTDSFGPVDVFLCVMLVTPISGSAATGQMMNVFSNALRFPRR